MQVTASFNRDANGVPITSGGLIVSSFPKNIVGNNTIIDVPIFTITGTVMITGIWGVITTALGNHTAAYWRLNDGSNTPAITVSTGTTLTSKGVGTTIVKKGLAAAALVALDASAAVVSEPTTLETLYFSPFIAMANNTATTNVEYVYTTTDTPTSGQITFYIQFLPLSQSASIVAI